MSEAKAASLADFADVIIVGGGTAGCVLANRLSQNSNRNVLLLEAGPQDTNPWIHIPLGFSQLFRNPKLNWCYNSQPQPELGNRQIYLPAGRVIGGSSAINGMVWVRGQAGDYDKWAEATGDESWGWHAMQPVLEKIDGYTSDTQQSQIRSGTTHLSRLTKKHPLSEAFINAAVSCGYRRLQNLNQSDKEGVGDYEITTKSGFRVSTGVSYLKPVRSRKNLKVLTRFRVLRVLINDQKRAEAVEVCKDGEVFILRARQGVVLSAGTFRSPQLLMLSGIGDRNELEGHGIATHVHLPAVGKNFQDHYGIRIIAQVDRSDSINSVVANPFRMACQMLQYAFRRSGIFAIGGAYSGAFYRSDISVETPDIQIHFLPLSSNRKGKKLDRFPAITANVCQLRPYSRGSVSLASADPFDDPLIDPAYLSDPRDLEVLVKGYRIGRKILNAASLATEYNVTEVAPGSAVQGDSELRAYIKNNGGTVFHPVGTCRMGNDEESVVDAGLKVRGIQNLWVTDASVIPFITSGNTYCPTLAVAERGADIINRFLEGKSN